MRKIGLFGVCWVVGCGSVGEVDKGAAYAPSDAPRAMAAEVDAPVAGPYSDPPAQDFLDTGAAGMAAPEPFEGEDAVVEVDEDRPPCIDNPTQVSVIGDSYINWASHSLPADLAARAGQSWPMHAIGGASMASGGVAGFIPDQFDNAIAQNPDTRMVLMDGGGNDLLIPDSSMVGAADCKNSADSPNMPVCQQIVDLALDEAEALMHRAADAGVRDVLYFFYPHVPEGTLIGGLHPNTILDHALPQARAMCDSVEASTGGALRCHFVDMVPVFGNDMTLFAPTDIHPNLAGSQKMADAIWGAMKDACIGQPAGSGCCAP